MSYHYISQEESLLPEYADKELIPSVDYPESGYFWVKMEESKRAYNAVMKNKFFDTLIFSYFKLKYTKGRKIHEGKIPENMKRTIVNCIPHNDGEVEIPCAGLNHQVHNFYSPSIVAKDELEKYQRKGFPVILIDRDNPRDSYKKIVDFVTESKEFTLFLFSHGGHETKGERLKPMIFRIAEKYGLPIMNLTFDHSTKSTQLSDPYVMTGDYVEDYDALGKDMNTKLPGEDILMPELSDRQKKNSKKFKE